MAQGAHAGEKAIVLLSGGIDSSTALGIALSEGYDVIALTFDYGQRHFHEIAAAKEVALSLNVQRHYVFPVELDAIGGSALTGQIETPKFRSLNEISVGIPVTYVPARNTIFLSIALAFAEVNDAPAIFIGANVIDYSGYPDCRPEFFEAFEQVARFGTKAGAEGKHFRIEAPLLQMTKAQIIKEAVALGVDLSLTSSCYDPDPTGLACGACDACILRRKGFHEAGVLDPTRYREVPAEP